LTEKTTGSNNVSEERGKTSEVFKTSAVLVLDIMVIAIKASNERWLKEIYFYKE